MKDEIKCYKSPLLEGGIDFQYRQIRGTFAQFGKEINIQAIFSGDQGKGNCQEFIKEWKRDLKERGFELVSSTPISAAWRHICKKYSLKIYE